MTESVYKVIELVGTSTESWEKAAAAAVERASKNLRDLRVAAISELHVQLGDWLMAESRAPEALREYQAVLALNPHDQAGAHYRLATAYRQLEDANKTREHLLYALEIAPHYREAQQLLLEIAR